jgi:hypothetical protein
MELSGSPVRFHPLSFLEDRGEVVIGRTDTGSFGVFPPDGAALVRELAAGRTPQGAAAWYAETYREEVDIAQFIASLRELALVREEGQHAETAGSAQVRWQGLGRALFSPPAWACYLGLLIAAVAVCVADERMLPSPQNMFFSDYLMVVNVSVFAGQLALTAVHEAFHALAGRRIGVPAGVTVSRRFYFVVLETNLDGLAVVPRRQRCLPLLAGLLCDLLAVAGLTVIAYLTRTPDGEVSAIGAVCLAMAFTTIPRMVWQFYFFLRTDIYYLISTLTGCFDLDSTARDLLANRVNSLLGRRDRLRDESRWHPRDRRAAPWYVPLMVAGYAAMIGLLVVMLPVAWQFVSTAAERVFGDAPSSAHFWDSALLLALTLCQLAVALVMVLRKQRSNTRKEK